MIRIGDSSTSPLISVGGSTQSIVHVAEYKTYPDGVVTTAITSTPELVYSNGGSSISAVGGDEDYAWLRAQLTTSIDGTPSRTEYIALNLEITNGSSSIWYIDPQNSAHVCANNRGATTGGTRTATIYGSFGDYRTPAGYIVTQTANTKHYGTTVINKIYIDGVEDSSSPYTGNIICAARDNVSLFVDGFQTQWYDSAPSNIITAHTLDINGSYPASNVTVDSHNWLWTLTNPSQDYVSFSNSYGASYATLSVTRNTSTSSSRQIDLKVTDTMTTLNFPITITQAADNYTFSFSGGTSIPGTATTNPYLVSHDQETFYVHIFSKAGSNNTGMTVSYDTNGIGLSHSLNYISAYGAYRVTFTAVTGNTV